MSRDVVFYEETFPFSKTLQEELEHEKGSMAKNLVGREIFEDPVALEHATDDGVHGSEVKTDCTQECDTRYHQADRLSFCLNKTLPP